MKTIAFVVPAYNVEEYITECLESFVCQTDRDFEVIIVNDGSTDEGTERISKQYCDSYPELFQYVYKENGGQGSARNTGMKYVEAPWITFLDSDDWLVPNYVEAFKKNLENSLEAEVDIYFTLPKVYNHVSHQITEFMDAELFYEIFRGKRVVNPQIEKRIFDMEVSPCRKIYRRTFLEKVNFAFREGVKWEDVYPHFYLLYHARSCMGIGEIGFYYRTNTYGQTTSTTGKRRLDIIKVFAETFAYLMGVKADEEIILKVVRTCIVFSKWSINVADIETRKELVKKLYFLYKCIPARIMKKYKKSCSKADRRFLYAMNHKIFNWLLYDYMVQHVSNAMINKLIPKRG
ncbi:MAG: glycosyltransferase family 2 protein [Lachnospiraceae bacterium]|nr:glycosyltransferase family 2 protein [Lachnospiraceae bacterium]